MWPMLLFSCSWKKEIGASREVQTTGEEWKIGTVHCKEEEKESQNWTEKSSTSTHIEISTGYTQNFIHQYMVIELHSTDACTHFVAVGSEICSECW